MEGLSSDNPILNNPYEEPKRYYHTNDGGELDYSTVKEGRRIFRPDLYVIPVRQGPQRSMLDVKEDAAEYASHPINLLRREIGSWRKAGYPSGTVTRVTKELLDFWFNNPERHPEIQLFFAQREAIETAIWLNEVAGKSNVGQHILSVLSDGRSGHMIHGGPDCVLPRTAFKMATGSGKTVVMAALILYHFFNRREYRQDTRFADYFLIIAPGITIRDRLGVLLPNDSGDPETSDYYHARRLVPRNREAELANLNSRIVITNYHSFEPRTLQGNKRSPFDGKLDADGNKQEAREDFGQVVKRVLDGFRADSRLLIINDEAHHCYLPKGKGKAIEGEDTKEENARAAVWFTGLVEISRRFKVGNIYDLSATPYYLTGSGFDAYSLFPWVVSDFGLTEAIESGLVKIPFLPESDNTQSLTQPVLRNIYEYVKDDLPKKGRKTAKAEAKKEGRVEREAPPNLPPLVRSSLEMFYKHYKEDYERIRGLFQHPPVFIVVCNNTSVSKEVYKYLAGYEWMNDDDEFQATPGVYDLFSNYDMTTHQPVSKPPTLLIDSDALENSNQVNEDFKKVFAREIELFKRDYARVHGHGAVESITDAHILREVVNTVGKTGTLGAHIRCVVSVSMLTEGWDANTVTHIMGLRAFGSQLLCEQVAGRALRRKNYDLESYDKDGNPTKDKRKIVERKFPPEYAHIIGIPFNSYKSGKTTGTTPVDRKAIYAMPEREEAFEISFPNVVGYRVEHKDVSVSADFSAIEPFEADWSIKPIDAVLRSAFSPEEEKLTVRDRLASLRDQELIYMITRRLIANLYRDDSGHVEFHRFAQIKRIVEEWYGTKVRVIGPRLDKLENPRLLLYYEDEKRICDHINLGIMQSGAEKDIILPVLNYYNPEGSTCHVHGSTARPVYPTRKSHVNYVVADTESWEQIAAKSLDDDDMTDVVISYVKNAYLNFAIPYVDSFGEDRQYFPDFIARCKAKDRTINLIIEITGMNQDKAKKREYVKTRWLPAVNAVRNKHGWDEWRFVEIEGDIRDIKNQIIAAVGLSGGGE